MSRMNDGLPDRKYYNVAIANNEAIANTSYTYAQYKDVLNQQIISNPSEYYLSVLRFQIPTANIPILIPEIESWPNTDVNKTVYNVALEYTNSGITYTGIGQVMYKPITTNYVPRPITVANPNPMINPSQYYFVYNYRAFIDMVNTAFETALSNLSAQVVLPPGVTAPYITYNAGNYLMSLHASPEYLTPAYSTIPPPQLGQINIYMNYKLFTFFDGIEFLDYEYDPLFPTTKTIQILIKSYNGTNFDGTHYIMAQQYPSLSVWNVFKGIQITSFFLPTESEIVPTPNGSTTSGGSSTYNTSPVVKDFIPFYENGPEFRTFINFRYNGSYELIDLNSNAPITTIDITVYWIDRYGNKYVVSIPYNQVLTIKFCFIKKSTFTG